MSVIFGIKENNRIIIAGDKRGSSIDGKTLSDDLDKVLMINDHLAFSSASNAAIEKAISIDLNKATNKDCLTTDDLLDIIKAFYKRVADTNCDAILAVDQHIIIWHFRRIKLCRNNAGIFHPRTPGILVITVIEKIITVITRLKMGYFNFPDSANYGIK